MSANETKPQETVKNKPVKYTLEQFRKNSLKLFGVTTSTFDGATVGLEGEFTLAEMQRTIDIWKSKKI